MRALGISGMFVTMLSSFKLMLCYNIFISYDIESRLEGGGVDRRKLKFTILNTLQAGVSVRINFESGREGKTNQPRI
jgi:hypothetical protein